MKNRVRKYINQTKGYIALGALLAVTGVAGTFWGFQYPIQQIGVKSGGCWHEWPGMCETVESPYTIGTACPPTYSGSGIRVLSCSGYHILLNTDETPATSGAKYEINRRSHECERDGVIICDSDGAGGFVWKLDENATPEVGQKCDTYYKGVLSGVCNTGT